MKNNISINKYIPNKNLQIFVLLFSLLILPFSFVIASTSVSTYPVSTLTKTSAIMNGYIGAQDGFSDVWFEFGTSPSNLDKKTGQKTVQNNRPFNIHSGDIKEGTRYYYRAIAVNNDGISFGNSDNFTTTGNPSHRPSNNTNNQGSVGTPITTPIGIRNNALPFVVTNFPQNVTEKSAVLKGQSIPSASGNLQTTVWFEWGTDKNTLTRTTPRRSVSGSTSENFEDTLTGLSPNTFYFYRAVIRNQNGEARGDMIRMKTLSFGPTTTITKPTTPKLIKGKAPVAKSKPKLEIKDQSASVSDKSNFFPNTLVGWLALIALLILIIVLSDHMYGARQKRKAEE